MVVERLVIQVVVAGDRAASASLNRLSRRAAASATGVNQLRSALLGLGAAGIARSLIRTTDAYTNFQNRLRLVTSSAGELNAVSSELIGISNKTRTSIETNATLFNRLALSTENLGLSKAELLSITRSLNEATQISSAGTHEARAALIQLSQAMARGVLRGDELRSVLEQAPVIAQVIAKEFGVTTHEIAALGEQGLLTAEKIILAFRRSREELTERFGDIIPTIGQAFVVLRNQFVVFVGKFKTGSGIATAFARAILELSENLDRLIRIGFFAGLLPALALAVTGFNKLALAIAANPVGALGVALSLAIGLLIEFRDEIFPLGDGLTSLGDIGRATFEEFVALFQIVREAGKQFVEEFTTLFNQAFGTQLSGTFTDFLKGIATGIDALIAVFSGVGAVISVAFEQPLQTAGFLIIETVNLIIRAINTMSRFISRQLRTLAGEIAKTISLIPGVAQATKDEVAQLAGSISIPEISELENQFSETGRTLGEAFNIGFQKAANEEGAVGVINRIAQRAREIGAERRVEELEAARKHQEELNKLLQPQQQTQQQEDGIGRIAARLVFGTRAGEAFADTMERSEITVKELATTIANIAVNAVDQLSGAIADFALTGFQDLKSFKEALSNIFRDIAREIIKLIIKFLILKLVSAAFSGGAAPVVDTTTVSTNQEGGPVGRDEPTIVGERGPELFVPQQSGTIVPNRDVGAGGGGSNVTIVNVRDPDEIPAAIESQPGEQAILNVLSRRSRDVNAIVQQGS